MFKRKRSYHVVYNLKNGVNWGFGSITITKPGKIKTEKDVSDVKKYIETEYNLNNIVILNWIKIKAIK